MKLIKKALAYFAVLPLIFISAFAINFSILFGKRRETARFFSRLIEKLIVASGIPR